MEVHSRVRFGSDNMVDMQWCIGNKLGVTKHLSHNVSTIYRYIHSVQMTSVRRRLLVVYRSRRRTTYIQRLYNVELSAS